MIWEINKIFQMIDKKKWNKLSDKQQKQFIIQIKIWVAINYIIHLHLSKRSIPQQLKLLLKYYNNEPNAFTPLQEKDVVELFFRVQPIIPILLYINYIGMTRVSKTQKKGMTSKRKSRNMKGGYLFMLTSRGEKPIRGVDMEEFLSKMDEAVQDISYLPSSAPPEEGPSNPYNGFALLYFLSRNKMDSASFYATPYLSDYINIFSKTKGLRAGTYKYTTLLRTWRKLQEEAKKAEKKQSANQEFMDNYEEFIKKYIGRQEFRERKDEYKTYLNNMSKYKEKNDIEKKLFEHYDKANPDPPDKLKQLEDRMSILDQITMVTSMMGI